MRVWLVHVGEPLPCDPGAERPLRIAMLAELLVERGHQVLWWSSVFDHNKKVERYPRETRLTLRPGYDLYLLRGVPYPTNVSFRRWANHWQLGRRFTQLAPRQERPDIVLSSIPTLELASAATAVARAWGVPAVVDVQDIWPDAITQTLPRFMRGLGRLLLRSPYRHARAALRQASTIVAVSPSYLRWGLQLAGRQARDSDKVFPLSYPALTADRALVVAAGEEVRRLGVDPGKKIAWFIGIFGRSYDLSTVIRAARQLQDDERLQFVLSGAGDNEVRWHREAAGLPNVVFTGWVKSAAIAYLMSVAWAGLAAYARDAPQSLPYKLFEYLSAGLPVLSTLSGDGQDLLTRHGCGVTYPAGDAAELASELQRLVNDPVRWQEMSENARRTFENRYHPRRVYNEFADYLEGQVPKA